MNKFYGKEADNKTKVSFTDFLTGFSSNPRLDYGEIAYERDLDGSSSLGTHAFDLSWIKEAGNASARERTTSNDARCACDRFVRRAASRTRAFPPLLFVSR
jgi:hypothetical protein